MARINRRQTAIKSRSMISLYLRACRKKRNDESNDDMFLFSFLLSILVLITILYPVPRYYLPQRSMWMDWRQQTQWEEVCMGEWLANPELLDARWYKEFRMTHKQFCKLVDLLTPFVKKQDTNMRKAIPVDKKLAIVLKRLGFGGSVHMGGNYLGVSPTVTSIFTNHICEVLVTHFYDKYIKIPEGNLLQEIMSGFENLTGIPYMWGAIDGCHIRLKKKPNEDQLPSDYYSCLKCHSILLQGVCDHKRRFLNICVRAPGGSHDAAHLRASSLWEKLQSGELPNKHHFKVGDKDVQPYVLGDSAYPLRIGLMKCFSSKGTGTPQQNLFDKRLRAGRVKIENAFGILKNKFHILKDLNVGLQYAPTLITACCILHNFLIEEGEIGGDEMDKDHNSKLPMKMEFISEEEKKSENIAKEQRDTLFKQWVKKKYRKEKRKLDAEKK